MGAGGASAAPCSAGLSLRNLANWAPINTIMQINTIIATTVVRRLSASASASAAFPCFSGDRMLGSVQRGNRAIKRIAIVPESGSVNGWSGSARINESSLRVAASAGIAARLAASCHGSRSRRANSDTTLSGIPLRSSPIGENRNESKSEPKRGTAAGAFEELLLRSTFRCVILGQTRVSSGRISPGLSLPGHIVRWGSRMHLSAPTESYRSPII
jgi:hypothetical protein